MLPGWPSDYHGASPTAAPRPSSCLAPAPAPVDHVGVVCVARAVGEERLRLARELARRLRGLQPIASTAQETRILGGRSAKGVRDQEGDLPEVVDAPNLVGTAPSPSDPGGPANNGWGAASRSGVGWTSSGTSGSGLRMRVVL